MQKTVPAVGVCSLILLAVLAIAMPAIAETPTSKPAANGDSSSVNTDELEVTRRQLFKLLRISPKLTAVVAQDPTLLADPQYVSRNNPELEQFLEMHPEIVRSPEFYLFANLGNGPPRRDLRLQASVWPELDQPRNPRELAMTGPFLGFLVFLCVLLSLLWLIRILLENRRWMRIFTRQSEAQNKLFDKFASSEDLLNYVRSDSGKHLVEFTTVPATLGPVLQSGSPLARILTPLQFGVVLTLVGIGFLVLKNTSVTNGQVWASEARGPLLVLGVVSSALGVGLLVSAGVSWAFARHLGILPAHADPKDIDSRDDSSKWR